MGITSNFYGNCVIIKAKNNRRCDINRILKSLEEDRIEIKFASGRRRISNQRETSIIFERSRVYRCRRATRGERDTWMGSNV